MRIVLVHNLITDAGVKFIYGYRVKEGHLNGKPLEYVEVQPDDVEAVRDTIRQVWPVVTRHGAQVGASI